MTPDLAPNPVPVVGAVWRARLARAADGQYGAADPALAPGQRWFCRLVAPVRGATGLFAGTGSKAPHRILFSNR
jgi:hypothetical protein